MKRSLMPLFALTLGLLLATQAMASSLATPGDLTADAPAATAKGPGFLDEDRVNQLEKMTDDQRDQFFRERREKFKNMSPEEIDSYKKQRREWFESLPEDRKAAMKDRMKKMHDERREKMKERVKSMSPEERAKFKEEMRVRREGRVQNNPTVGADTEKK